MPGPAKGTGGALRKISSKAGKKEREVEIAKGTQATLTSIVFIATKTPSEEPLASTPTWLSNCDPESCITQARQTGT